MPDSGARAFPAKPDCVAAADSLEILEGLSILSDPKKCEFVYLTFRNLHGFAVAMLALHACSACCRKVAAYNALHFAQPRTQACIPDGDGHPIAMLTSAYHLLPCAVHHGWRC